MFVEFNKLKQGHILILNKNEEFSKRCFVCGKDVEVPFFICVTQKLPFHEECENRTKCKPKSFKEDHFHLKIVEVKK